MPDAPSRPHILVRDAVAASRYQARSGRGPVPRVVDERAAHGRQLFEAARASFEAARLGRAQYARDLGEDLQATGTVVVVEAAGEEFPLALESLDRADGRWRLLSVAEDHVGRPERAEVWIADAHRARFLALLEEYATETTVQGAPRHNALVANMSAIRHAILDDLWSSDGEPPKHGLHAWELWLSDSSDALGQLRSWAGAAGVTVADRVVVLSGRVVVCVVGSWESLLPLPFTSVPLTEVRKASLVDSIVDLAPEEQSEFVDDLAGRVTPATSPDAPAVCHLDTGVRRSHVRLAGPGRQPGRAGRRSRHRRPA